MALKCVLFPSAIHLAFDKRVREFLLLSFQMPGKNSHIPKFDNDASISRGPKDLANIDALVHKLFEDFVETNNTENIVG